jgi:hypothetical protein
MTNIYKYMTTIAVWVLFFFGLSALVAGFARAFNGGSLPMVSAYFGYGIVSLFLSVVCARLGKLLD